METIYILALITLLKNHRGQKNIPGARDVLLVTL